MIDIDTKRSKIQEFIEDVQSADSYFIGSAEIHWIPGTQEWMLKVPNQRNEYEGNGCGTLLQFIQDSDIEAYYEELRKDWFEDEETA
jgi:hypothetical protein